MAQRQPKIRVNIRIDGDPIGALLVTEALRTLMGDAAQLGIATPSRRDRYKGTALTYGSADAYQLAERAATIADLEQPKGTTEQTPKERA